jgi:hypothetical protein
MKIAAHRDLGKLSNHGRCTRSQNRQSRRSDVNYMLATLDSGARDSSTADPMLRRTATIWRLHWRSGCKTSRTDYFDSLTLKATGENNWLRDSAMWHCRIEFTVVARSHGLDWLANRKDKRCLAAEHGRLMPKVVHLIAMQLICFIAILFTTVMVIVIIIYL